MCFPQNAKYKEMKKFEKFKERIPHSVGIRIRDGGGNKVRDRNWVMVRNRVENRFRNRVRNRIRVRAKYRQGSGL